MFYLNTKIFLILWRTKDSQLLRPHTTSSERRSEDCINRACIWFQGATGKHVSLALSFLLSCLWVFPPIWMTLHLFSNWSNISLQGLTNHHHLRLACLISQPMPFSLSCQLLSAPLYWYLDMSPSQLDWMEKDLYSLILVAPTVVST